MTSLLLKTVSTLSVFAFLAALVTPAMAARRPVLGPPIVVTTTAKPPVSLP